MAESQWGLPLVAPVGEPPAPILPYADLTEASNNSSDPGTVGLRGGFSSVGKDLHNLMGQTGLAMGLEDYAANQFVAAEKSAKEEMANTPFINSTEQVNSLGRLGSFVSGMAGRMVAPMAVAGALGLGLRNATAGVGLGFGALGAGQQVETLRNDPKARANLSEEQLLGNSLATGAGQGLLFAGPGVLGQAARGATTVARGAAGQAAAMGGADLLAQSMHKQANKDYEINTNQALEQAGIGAALGAGGALVHGALSKAGGAVGKAAGKVGEAWDASAEKAKSIREKLGQKPTPEELSEDPPMSELLKTKSIDDVMALIEKRGENIHEMYNEAKKWVGDQPWFQHVKESDFKTPEGRAAFYDHYKKWYDDSEVKPKLDRAISTIKDWGSKLRDKVQDKINGGKKQYSLDEDASGKTYAIMEGYLPPDIKFSEEQLGTLAGAIESVVKNHKNLAESKWPRAIKHVFGDRAQMMMEELANQHLSPDEVPQAMRNIKAAMGRGVNTERTFRQQAEELLDKNLKRGIKANPKDYRHTLDTLPEQIMDAMESAGTGRQQVTANGKKIVYDPHWEYIKERIAEVTNDPEATIAAFDELHERMKRDVQSTGEGDIPRHKGDVDIHDEIGPDIKHEDRERVLAAYDKLTDKYGMKTPLEIVKNDDGTFSILAKEHENLTEQDIRELESAHNKGPSKGEIRVNLGDVNEKGEPISTNISLVTLTGRMMAKEGQQTQEGGVKYVGDMFSRGIASLLNSKKFEGMELKDIIKSDILSKDGKSFRFPLDMQIGKLGGKWYTYGDYRQAMYGRSPKIAALREAFRAAKEEHGPATWSAEKPKKGESAREPTNETAKALKKISDYYDEERDVRARVQKRETDAIDELANRGWEEENVTEVLEGEGGLIDRERELDKQLGELQADFKAEKDKAAKAEIKDAINAVKQEQFWVGRAIDTVERYAEKMREDLAGGRITEVDMSKSDKVKEATKDANDEGFGFSDVPAPEDTLHGQDALGPRNFDETTGEYIQSEPKGPKTGGESTEWTTRFASPEMKALVAERKTATPARQAEIDKLIARKTELGNRLLKPIERKDKLAPSMDLTQLDKLRQEFQTATPERKVEIKAEAAKLIQPPSKKAWVMTPKNAKGVTLDNGPLPRGVTPESMVKIMDLKNTNWQADAKFVRDGMVKPEYNSKVGESHRILKPEEKNAVDIAKAFQSEFEKNLEGKQHSMDDDFVSRRSKQLVAEADELLRPIHELLDKLPKLEHKPTEQELRHYERLQEEMKDIRDLLDKAGQSDAYTQRLQDSFEAKRQSILQYQKVFGIKSARGLRLLSNHDIGEGTVTEEQKQAVRNHFKKVLGFTDEQTEKLFKDFKAAGERGVGTFETGLNGEEIAHISLQAADPLSVAYHESMHAFFKRITKANPEIGKTLLRAANSPHIQARLRELLKGKGPALEQLSDPHEALAYMYQFAAAAERAGRKDMITLGPQTRTLFGKIKGFFRKLAAIWSSNTSDRLSVERAGDLLADFHEGKFAERNRVADVLAERYPPDVEQQAKRLFPWLEKFANHALYTASGAIRGMKFEPTTRIMDLMHNDVGVEGKGAAYDVARHAAFSYRMNKVAAALKGLRPSETQEVLAELRSGNALVSEPAKKLRALLDETYQYMKDKKVKHVVWRKGEEGEKGHYEELPLDDRYLKNYFPRVFDSDALMKPEVKQAFMKVLEEHGIVGQEADGVYSKVIKDADSGKPHEDIHLGVTFFTPQLRERGALGSIPDAKLAPFLVNDLYGTMSQYLSRATRRAEYADRFGNQGQEIAKARREAIGAGMTEAQAKTFDTAIQAFEGTLGHDMDPTLKNIYSGLMTYQNIRLLPFQLLSSVVDPGGIMVRGGTLGEALNAFGRGVKEIFTGMKEDERAQYAKMVGTIDAGLDNHLMSELANSAQMSKGMKWANDKFFKYNGMEGWNKSMRIVATSAAHDFIVRHATRPTEHSERYLRELGITAEEVKAANKDGRLDPDNEKMRNAISQWVDESILRPTVANRPIYMSDPNWMLVSHLKQYSYLFQKVIMNRAINEFQHGNYTPAYTLAGYVPVMMASDAMRAAVTPTNGDNQYQAQWTGLDRFEHGVMRAGLLGPGQLGVDVDTDLAMDKPWWNSIMGPTVEQLTAFLHGLGTGNVGKELIDAVPLAKQLGFGDR